jgi:hypothetical protein
MCRGAPVLCSVVGRASKQQTVKEIEACLWPDAQAEQVLRAAAVLYGP